MNFLCKLWTSNLGSHAFPVNFLHHLESEKVPLDTIFHLSPSSSSLGDKVIVISKERRVSLNRISIHLHSTVRVVTNQWRTLPWTFQIWFYMNFWILYCRKLIANTISPAWYNLYISNVVIFDCIAIDSFQYLDSYKSLTIKPNLCLWLIRIMRFLFY